MTITTFFLLSIAGTAAGFVDAVAGDGGLITVPALLWAGLPPQMVLGTNKLQSSCGTIMAVVRYARAGLIRWRQVRLAVLITFIGSTLGTVAVTQVSNAALKQLVPWLLLALAVYALLSPRLGATGGKAKLSPLAFALLAGSALGFYDGFFGPGVGSFWTLACVGLLGLELTRATAFTKVVNLASNIASLIVFIHAGKVVYEVAASMIIGQLIGARLGSGMVLRHGAGFVRVVFLVVVFAMTAKLLWEQW